MKLKVALNGTDKNPFTIYGVSQNPFPQIAKREYQARIMNMQKLGGPPIPKDNAEHYIRETLNGWSQEFIELCVSKYRPGEYVKFEVNFDDKTAGS